MRFDKIFLTKITVLLILISPAMRADNIPLQTMDTNSRGTEENIQIGYVQSYPCLRKINESPYIALFDNGKATILAKYHKNLDEVATCLRTHKHIGVLVDGFTSQTGNFTFNMVLSKQRANSIRKELVKRGVEPDNIIINSFGSIVSDIPENWQSTLEIFNRRVNLTPIVSKDMNHFISSRNEDTAMSTEDKLVVLKKNIVNVDYFTEENEVLYVKYIKNIYIDLEEKFKNMDPLSKDKVRSSYEIARDYLIKLPKTVARQKQMAYTKIVIKLDQFNQSMEKNIYAIQNTIDTVAEQLEQLTTILNTYTMIKDDLYIRKIKNIYVKLGNKFNTLTDTNKSKVRSSYHKMAYSFNDLEKIPEEKKQKGYIKIVTEMNDLNLEIEQVINTDNEL